MRSALLLAITALPFLGVDALTCSTNARCGIQSKGTLTCKNSVFGNCCSKYGFCGSSSLFCGDGCQAGFGDCRSSIATSAKSSLGSAKPSSTSAKPSISSLRVTVDAVKSTSASSTPSAASQTSTLSTVTSSFVPATSASSSLWTSLASVPLDSPSASPSPSPSSTLDSSSALSSSVPTTSSSPLPDVKISADGTCGGTQGFTCSGSAFGNCCSEYGWCGSTGIYCDAGCNAAYGNCNTASPSAQPSSSPSPTPIPSSPASSSFITSTRTTIDVPSTTGSVSTNGQCGASSNGMTCLGSQFGDCCSQYDYCGSTSAFCGTGCQSGFGNCEAPPAPGNTCGAEGFANKEEYYASSFDLIDTVDVSTCANLCLAEATCMSYLFNPGLGNCAYLTYSLAQGEFIATTSTNQFFWDRACAETATA